MAIGASGYAILRGPLADAALTAVRQAVVDAIARADPEDVRIGSTTVRVNGILGGVPELAALLDHAPLLAAADEIIGGPFRLSSLHARSVKPRASAQALHQDITASDDGWPLAGFILMLDPFTEHNGATRFVPGTRELMESSRPPGDGRPGEALACGGAGALVVFDGSTWHGHDANTTATWRHSVQGAFIPKAARPSVDFPRILPNEVLHRLSPAARNLL